MENAPAERTTVLQGLGLFKIWTTLILTPLLVVVLIIGMVVAATYQRGWQQSTATATADVNDCPSNSAKGKGWTCAVKVSVNGLPGDLDLKVEESKSFVKAGETWPVAYDASKVQATLTTLVMTPRNRLIIEAVLGVFLFLAVAFFVLNLTLRKNRTWQNVSGVMEGADLASALLRR